MDALLLPIEIFKTKTDHFTSAAAIDSQHGSKIARSRIAIAVSPSVPASIRCTSSQDGPDGRESWE